MAAPITTIPVRVETEIGTGCRRGGGGREDEYIPEEDLETREGLLDILPEGYGFLKITGYLSGDKDVYVSANQVRKFRLRKGDIVSGPIRPPRSKEKFAAVVRIDKVNGMTSDEAMKRPKFESLTPLFPDERLRLEIDGRANGILTRIVDLITDRQGSARFDCLTPQGRQDHRSPGDGPGDHHQQPRVLPDGRPGR